MGAKKVGVVAAETVAPPAGDGFTPVEDINLPKQRKISKEQLEEFFRIKVGQDSAAISWVVSEEAINPRSNIDIRTVEEQAIEDGTDVIAITSYDDESSEHYEEFEDNGFLFSEEMLKGLSKKERKKIEKLEKTRQKDLKKLKKLQEKREEKYKKMQVEQHQSEIEEIWKQWHDEVIGDVKKARKEKKRKEKEIKKEMKKRANQEKKEKINQRKQTGEDGSCDTTGKRIEIRYIGCRGLLSCFPCFGRGQ